jgi:AraC-like DNA-binding protein
MGERKLQLGLKREGASFQSILDHNRYHMALQLLTREKLPVTRIALQLGFREVSSFTRAFKRWTGSTPREFSSSS